VCRFAASFPSGSSIDGPHSEGKATFHLPSKREYSRRACGHMRIFRDEGVRATAWASLASLPQLIANSEQLSRDDPPR
jgi:hypothetical protein